MKKSLKIVLGDVAYPKSEVLVIPANSKGLMSFGREKIIADAGGPNLLKDVRSVVSQKEYGIGECFFTEPARLKRRGVKKICHCVIKRLPSDYTSLTIISQTLQNVLSFLVKSGEKSITICGFGIEDGDLDKKSVARIFVEKCRKYEVDAEIKIMDRDEEFINEVVSFLGE